VNTKIAPVFTGIAMLAGLSENALAGWQDNAPHQFVPQQHQRMLRDQKAKAGRTNGSIKVAPRAPAVQRPAQTEKNF
jgi:hypothetical protein